MRWFGKQPTRARPARIAVVTDSAAALPVAWYEAAAGPLAVVPMPVTVDGAVYQEGAEDLKSSLSLALAEGRPVGTSRPSPKALERAYRRMAERGYEAIVSVHISSGLSGTVDAARLAAEQVDVPVHVLDSSTVGMAQGYAVMDAMAAAEAGNDVDEVFAAAERAVADTSLDFYVPSLEQLRRGGRVGAGASWLGTMLAIKPILSVRDGAVVPLERIRTAPRAMARLEDLAVASLGRGEGPADLAVHYFGNRDQAQQMLARISERSPVPVDSLTTDLPAVLAAHAGLGVLAVVVRHRRDPAPP